MMWAFTHMANQVFNISTLVFSLQNGNLAQYLSFMVLKRLRKN